MLTCVGFFRSNCRVNKNPFINQFAAIRPIYPAVLRCPWITLGCCLPLMAQEPTFTLAPGPDNHQLGACFAVMGDINGDRAPEIAVSDPTCRNGALLGSGIVYIVNGADGSILRSHAGTPASNQLFGSSLASLDANGDGVLDLAVGAPGHMAGAGSVTIHSGTDGSVISVAVGPAASQFGSALANAGDQNGNGTDDLFVGAPNLNSRGAVYVRSGSDGTHIRTFLSASFISSFGLTVARVGDLDGDGLSDLAVGSPNVSSQAGRVSLIRSSDAAVQAVRQGSGNFNRLGDSLATVHDANGDGLPDVLVGSYSGGTALLLSGADLTLLRDLSLQSLPPLRQVHVGGDLDFDEDGISDWLIGSAAMNLSGALPAGGIRIVSGADGSTLFERLSTVANTGLGLGPAVLPGYGFAAGEKSLVDPVTGGRGLAHVWRLVNEPLDSDGDGIPDEEDAVPFSIMDPTVVLGGIDSGVSNVVDGNGTTIADRFAVLGAPSDYRQPSHFIRPVHTLALELHQAGLLTKKEFQQITQAAVRAMQSAR